ncbi:AAA family ATPase [Haloarchaeobius iranensis]|uniref:ATPase family associated with various cellular activities (AAA) n=1 Tax=Haloarchaeobius iranensis TaxID=996166 RepID=A0A1G9SY10_9EURY|nr:ATP-binding protein [Haloarchaeobius iranensis]SDM40310.1 ATPase family associated with various cellular activities (AAA) [Haloarchaeobius iranensis]
MSPSSLSSTIVPLASGGLAGWASTNPFLAASFCLFVTGSAYAFSSTLRGKDLDLWLGLLGIVSGLVAIVSGQAVAMVGWLLIFGLVWTVTVGHFYETDKETEEDALAQPDGSASADSGESDDDLSTLIEEAATEGEDEETAGIDPADVVEPSVGRTLDGIAGMTEQVDAIRNRVLDPRSNSELYADSGVDSVSGALLFGPPACGKRTLASATAESLSVPFLSVDPTTSLGDGADTDELVEDVSTLARSHSPCVLFLEAVDSFASAPDQDAPSRRFVVLLGETLADDEDVLVFGSARSMDAVPDQLRKGGCFDERIAVPLPDRETRAALLAEFLNEEAVAASFDWWRAADQLEGCDAADIEYVADRLTRQSVRTGEAVETSDVRAVARETGQEVSEVDHDVSTN